MNNSFLSLFGIFNNSSSIIHPSGYSRDEDVLSFQFHMGRAGRSCDWTDAPHSSGYAHVLDRKALDESVGNPQW